ncbi:MAG: hypothetical protein HQL56_06900 [Magnetococcales bacterium]|nr:hypothetical protein [Magnetococcales bacterium]
MTYLQLCQEVARATGVVDGLLPTSVVGQTGRLADIVVLVAEAWLEIQNKHVGWLWLQKEFPEAATPLTTAGTARYTSGSWNISDLANWITLPGNMTLYAESTGVADEGPIGFVEWDLYRRYYGRGVQDQGRPVHFSISPQNEFCLGPIPDGIYHLRGEYRAAPQVLAANGDVPGCPARHHRVIALLATDKFARQDEAARTLVADVFMQYLTALGDLEMDQLPKPRIGGALA